MQWNINFQADGGNGQVVTLQSGLAGEIQDIGASLYDINSNGFPDLIVTYTLENPLDTYKTYYKIWKDIKRETTATNSKFIHSGTAGGTEITAASASRGSDAFVWDIDNDGQKNIVLFAIKQDASSEERLYYYYAELNTDYSIGSWVAGLDNGDVIISGQFDIGATLYDSSKRLVAISFNNNGVRMQMIEFEGTSFGHKQLKYGPILDFSGLEDGVGGVEAFDFGGVPSVTFPEQVYMWIQNNVAYWAVEYDSRLNSHP
jgi:hypothetical protein